MNSSPTGVARSNGLGVKATPAVRALARQLEVDLDVVDLGAVTNALQG